MPVSSAADLYHRVYLKVNSGAQAWTRSIKVEASLWEATAIGGKPPEAGDAAWTLVPGSNASSVGDNQGLGPYLSFVDPDNITKDFISIKTVVGQAPELWEIPFEVVHELWANSYIQGHADFTTGAAYTSRSHYHADLNSKRKPGWAGG